MKNLKLLTKVELADFVIEELKKTPPEQFRLGTVAIVTKEEYQKLIETK